MKRLLLAASVACLIVAGSGPVRAGENELTAAEKAEGWQLLFDGRSAAGWINNNGKPVADTVVEDGCLVPFRSGGYVLCHEKPFADFVLKCEVKLPASCNSGIFFRIGTLANPVQTGFEMQVMTGKGTGLHDFGAIYDLVPPKKNNQKPPGEWNAVEIRCQGPSVKVSVNGELVSELNADEWMQPGQRLDGSKNKFKAAVKDFPRSGHLGFQDHGAKVWYRNVKVLDLSPKK